MSRNTVTCFICKYSTTNISDYLQHLKYHTSYSAYKCGYKKCSVTCKSIKRIQSHIFRDHLSLHTNNHKLSSNECSVASCHKFLLSGRKLVSHLRSHIDCGITIKCPIVNCDINFSNKGTFSSHLSRKHYNQLELGESSQCT